MIYVYFFFKHIVRYVRFEKSYGPNSESHSVRYVMYECCSHPVLHCEVGDFREMQSSVKIKISGLPNKFLGFV